MTDNGEEDKMSRRQGAEAKPSKPRRPINKIKLRSELLQEDVRSFEDLIAVNRFERRDAPSKRTANFSEKPPTSAEISSALRPYAEAIGRANIQWNNLQQQFATFFWTVFEGNNEEAIAVWHAITSDRTQRLMLKEASKIKFIVRAHHPSILTDEQADRSYAIYDRIEFLLDQAQKFEDTRNNAIHSPIRVNCTIDHFHVYLDRENFRAQAFVEKLKHNNLTIVDELNYLERSLSTLNKFASEFWYCWVRNQPLPDRPRMPHRAPRRRRNPSHRKAKPD
jgi:hypothetical protein